MAWTSPRTWVHAEVPTASIFNTHLRDNLTFLKTYVNDAGKIPALSSTYIANLSGANLTGLVISTGANTYTVGKQNFGADSTSRFLVPVGTDKFDGSAGNKTAGSIWVEGNYLHHVSSTQVEWRFLGDVVGTPGGGALAGSVWFEANELHYLDSTAVERKVLGTTSGMHSDAFAVTGSIWVESYLHFVPTNSQETQGHEDVTHQDAGTHTDSHTDVTHQDNAHQDTHGDSHSDVAYVDAPHSDTHSDYYTNEGNWDPWHGDVHSDDYSDNPHADSHTDTHSDTHSDAGHYDVPHTDVHGDASHADVAHADRPENMGT